MKTYRVDEFEARILLDHYRRDSKETIRNYLSTRDNPQWYASPERWAETKVFWLRHAKEKAAEARRWAKKTGLPLGRPARPKITPVPKVAVAA